MKFSLIFFFCLSTHLLSSQPANSEMFAFSLVQINDTTYDVHSPKLLSHFNIDGYNNQPHFINQSQFLFTAQRPMDSDTDIFLIDLKDESLRQITETTIAEYSPTPMPDKSTFSVVRVEEDGWQTLWQYPMTETAALQNLFPNFKEDIGYHTWLNDSLVALFVLGEPPTLRIGNTQSQLVSTYTSDIGRCLKTTNDQNLFFIHRFSDQLWYLKKFNPYTKLIETLAEFPVDCQDFELIQHNKIVIGQDSKLLIYEMDRKRWIPGGDLSVYGVDKISRLAYNQGTLILISSE